MPSVEAGGWELEGSVVRTVSGLPLLERGADQAWTAPRWLMTSGRSVLTLDKPWFPESPWLTPESLPALGLTVAQSSQLRQALWFWKGIFPNATS